jgi:regulator of protease activity HflC (stomatin/prohibitin superfamily)
MTTVPEIAAGVTVEFLIFAFALGILYRLYGRILPTPQRVIVRAFEKGVILRGAKVERVVGPGAYWISPKSLLALCDMRPKPFQVQGQDLIAADHARLRVSLGGEYRIVDPARFICENSDSYGAFFLELRQSLRVAATELSNDSILGSQSPLTVRVRDLLVPRAAQLGLELTRLDVWEVVLVGWPHPA